MTVIACDQGEAVTWPDVVVIVAVLLFFLGLVWILARLR